MPAYESRYAGRRSDCAVVNMTLDTEALNILETYCPPGRKNLGAFIARLLYEHRARCEERLRLQRIMQDICGEGTKR